MLGSCGGKSAEDRYRRFGSGRLDFSAQGYELRHVLLLQQAWSAGAEPLEYFCGSATNVLWHVLEQK